jgi:hypothetical protein
MLRRSRDDAAPQHGSPDDAYADRLIHPSLEIHVPIAPTELFFNMVRCLTQSLRTRGGRYADARVVVTVGDESTHPGIEKRLPWLESSGVELRWVAPETYAKVSYYGTAVQRFTYDFESDVVMILDADVLVARPFDDLIREVHLSRCFAGCIGDVSPWRGDDRPDPWEAFYEHLGLGPVPYAHEHGGFGEHFTDAHLRYCPAYFNLGVLVAPASTMRTIGEGIFDMLERVRAFEFGRKKFACQLAVGATVTGKQIPYFVLPQRYNFWNERRSEIRQPGEYADVRLIHLTRPVQPKLHKSVLFADQATIGSFVRQRKPAGINGVIQDILREGYPSLSSEPTMIGA